MIFNYFKTAWRNLAGQKAFTLINILGLSIGISVCFIILLFVQDELSFDRFNTKADRIVRIIFKSSMNGSVINEAFAMPPTARTLKSDYPEVEAATRLRNFGAPRAIIDGKRFDNATLAYADSNFFEVFSIPLLKGDPKKILQQPNSLVLSRELAIKYFGNQDPLGKLIYFQKGNDSPPFKVTGIFDKIPSNAHFHFDMFGSMVSDAEEKSNSWMTSGFYTYLVLQEGYDYRKLQAKLPDMVEKYMGPQIIQEMGMSLSQFRTKGNKLGFELQPLTDIHLHSNSNYEIEPGGDIKYVYLFGAIAVFMLLIACINFINLSTASASKRAKEVGIRKVMGSGRGDLVKQFLIESILLALAAIAISLFVINLTLPIFNDLSGKRLNTSFNIEQLSMLAGMGLLVGLLAGVYPAFFLSSFKPVAVLKGRISASTKSLGLRSGLVVFQFFISVTLIIGAIVVYQQMKFIQSKKLGYEKEQLIVLPNSWALGKNEKAFKEYLLADPRVANVTISGYKPAGPSFNNNAMAYPEGKKSQFMKTIEYKIDEQYIPTLGMQMISGRNFSTAFPADSSSMIINETAAKTFGWKDNAIGQRIIRENSDRGKNIAYTVIGIVKDFHFRSLHETITPLLMILKPEWGLIVKAKPDDISGLLKSMKKEWDNYKTEEPFDYAFMDELYSRTYIAEQKTGRILNIFAILTIFVACLGLFGLAAYTAEQRTREIGIRKVLGASVTQVTSMLSREFLKLVLIASIIAFPMAWWAMNSWLQDFAYRIHLSWWIFILAAGSAFLIALLTVSFQAMKAATANPVDSLRIE